MEPEGTAEFNEMLYLEVRYAISLVLSDFDGNKVFPANNCTMEVNPAITRRNADIDCNFAAEVLG
jgi:hypothetical protein